MPYTGSVSVSVSADGPAAKPADRGDGKYERELRSFLADLSSEGLAAMPRA
jgi:hypothetical protein